MPIIADCHLHSSYSEDSKTPMEDMILRALELGLKEMCFTEHMDIDFIRTEDEPEGYFEVDTDAYQKGLYSLREKYRDKIRINFGIELGMQTHISQRNADYVRSYPFDFVIASSHLCNRMDPYLKEQFFRGREEKDCYHEYFRYMAECIKGFDDFDIYGHLDYVLRYGPTRNTNFRYEEYQEDIDRVLKLLIEKGKGIEANTSGYPYGMGEPHPCRTILSRYKELGGEILTIGSDAHAPERIAGDFDQVRELLLDTGFTHYCIFHERRPTFHAL